MSPDISLHVRLLSSGCSVRIRDIFLNTLQDLQGAVERFARSLNLQKISGAHGVKHPPKSRDFVT